MTTHMIDDARIHPDNCQPWCWARTTGQGHMPGGDLECWTEHDDRVTLSTEPLIDGDFDGGKSGFVPDFVDVYLWKVEGGPTTVAVSHHNLVGFHLTPAEALEFAAKLIEWAEVAER